MSTDKKDDKAKKPVNDVDVLRAAVNELSKAINSPARGNVRSDHLAACRELLGAE